MRAHQHEQGLNERERSTLQAAEFRNQHKMSQALVHLEQHCRTWPQDLIAIKVTEFLYYCKGQSFESTCFLETTEYCLPYHA